VTTRSIPPAAQLGDEIPEQLRTELAGRYALEHEIGHGGMARVYRARDLRHRRHVAVKVLAPELVTTLGAERFLREIQAAAQLLHPHILGLIDSGDAGGLLYYIMPYVRGETLRSRIEREKRLSLSEAARIVREVASALDHAHEYADADGGGIVHRDIKPENILLASGTHAMVADFGLARAIVSATRRKITISGMIVGTPPYMSPEQTLGGPVDGRSDIYSLACVLFEMLAGTPPFVADNVDGLLALHRVAPSPRVRVHRPDLPQAVDQVIQRALLKDPDARYVRAGDFSQALDAALAGYRAALRTRMREWLVGLRRRTGRTGAVVAAAGALTIVTGSLVATPVGERIVSLWTALPDTTRYIVVPFRRVGATPAEPSYEVILRDAISRWEGLKVVDQFQVADAVAQQETVPLSSRDAQRVAKQLSARRYVWGDVRRVGDSVRIDAALFDVRHPGTALETRTIQVPLAGPGVESQLRGVADAFVFRGAAAGRGEVRTGTSSYAAAQAYLRGQQALQDLNLAAADTALSAAIRADSSFAAASLWLGYVRAWREEPAQSRVIAQRAVAGREQLPARERRLADALLHLARGAFPEACDLYKELKSADPRDFAATYGLGECIRRDTVVVPDPRSRSGWRFRSSYHQAVIAYREALELLPSIHKAFRARAFEQVRRIMMTSTNSRRNGRPLPPDTTSFRAAPSWEGDSLVFVPFPIRVERVAPERTVSSTTVDAVNHQRATFRDIAASWRRAFPDAVEPLEAMAVALELLGDSTALDTLRVARRLTTDGDQRLRLATQEVWLLVKLGVPDDVARLTAARKLADSLLAPGEIRTGSAHVLAGLAVLTGRGHRAAAIARGSAGPQDLSVSVSGKTISASRALLVYSALDGPVDSLHVLERRVATAIIDNTVTAHQRLAATRALVMQAAMLAFPTHSFASVSLLRGPGNAPVDAQLAVARGDSAEARRMLTDYKNLRATRRPADLTLDATYAGARTLLAIGDSATAIAWLDPVLNAAQLYPPDHLTRVANAGAFMRSLILRADLAHQTGDRAAARRWARPVAELWRNADPFLQPDVQRMRALATQ
jgi:tetratricopeptide (TPR) repeat protein